MNAPKIDFELMPKDGYLFDPRVLHRISRKAVGMPLVESFRLIADELDKAYPGHICKEQEWLFNNAGGSMGQLTILHGSLREYILLFGTCLGTGGHSGSYNAEIFDFVISGEVRNEYEGRFSPEIGTPESDQPLYLGRKMIKHYRIPGEAWMLEYARGNIVGMLPFALMDSATSTLDGRTIARTLARYGKLVAGELRRGKDMDLLLRFGLAAGFVAGSLAVFGMRASRRVSSIQME